VLLSDRKNAVRAFAIAALLFAVAFLISASSDEGGVRFATRLARALPLAPLCSAIAARLTLASSRAKIEALTLESLGRSPSRNNAGAVAGAALFALAAAALVGLSSRIDIDAIFPSFSAAPRIAWNGTSFVDPARGVIFETNGEIRAMPAGADHASTSLRAAPAHERSGASVALALAAIAFPLFAASSTRRISPGVVMAVAASAFLTFLAFDAVASARAPAAVLVLPQAALLFVAVVEYRRSGCLVPW
jgi:hypothetical protein